MGPPPGHQGSHRLERLWGKASLTAGERRFRAKAAKASISTRRVSRAFFMFFSNKIHRFWCYFFIIGCCLGYFLGAFLLDISCPFCFAHSSIRAGLLDESIVRLGSFLASKWLH